MLFNQQVKFYLTLQQENKILQLKLQADHSDARIALML
jgi:hypothetical protein